MSVWIQIIFEPFFGQCTQSICDSLKSVTDFLFVIIELFLASKEAEVEMENNPCLLMSVKI